MGVLRLGLLVILLSSAAHGDFGDSEGMVEMVNEARFYDAQELPEGMGGSISKDTGMWIPPHDGIPMSFDPRYGKDSDVRNVWRPNRDAKPEDFEYLIPEMCAINAVNQTLQDKLPGFGSKRVALVFRGDSLRGFSYGINMKGVKGDEGKRAFYCTDLAMAVGEATAKAQIRFLVEPLEAQGFHVDIYLSGYGCTGLQHISKQEAKDRYEDMVGWYGKRVVAHQVFDRDSVSHYLQDAGTQQAMMLLLKSRPLNYHSIMLWRYDMVPYSPIGPSKCKYDDKKCFHDIQDEGGVDDWKNYIMLAERNLYLIEGSPRAIPVSTLLTLAPLIDDWGYTWPGWFSNCGENAVAICAAMN
jgi:hypothetical protein